MYRRRFTKTFKQVALLKLKLGISEEEVAHLCNVSKWVLRRWQKEADEFGAKAFGGYGRSRTGSTAPKSIRVYLHVTADELDAVNAASSSHGFRSVAEFVRSRLFHTTGEPVLRIQTLLEELTIVVRGLAEHLGKRLTDSEAGRWEQARN